LKSPYAAGTNAPWFELAKIPAPPAITNLTVDDRVYDSNRIYRLVIEDPPTRIDRLTRNADGVRIFFAVQGGRSYQVQGRDVLGAAPWTVLTNFTPGVSTNVFSYFDVRQRDRQFYRLMTPMRLASFSSIQKSPALFSFQFNGNAGVNYVVEYCQYLSTNSWSVLTNITPGVTTNVIVFDNAAPIQQRLYRVKVD
jgi:hypothetical protein